MNRRCFLKSSLAGGCALGLPTLGPATAPTGPMPRRALGRTGLQVSLLGLPGWQPGTAAVSQAGLDALVTRAAEIGINYIDTAPNYGDSEEKYGRALEGRRRNFILSTKTEEPGYDATWRLLEQSLRRLRTDRVDLVMLHGFGNIARFPDLPLLLGKRGAVAALEQAREQKLVGFIGASGHNFADRFITLLDTGRFDVFMNPVNYVVQHSYGFETRLWPRAWVENLGLVGMKVLGGGDPKPKGFRLPRDSYELAIRYALSVPGLSNLVIGLDSVAELDQAAATVMRVAPLSPDERAALFRRGQELLKANPVWEAPYGGPATG
jgi:aryl-alcohol dehydrogenase-like predicted oxidoreductase